MSGGLVALLDDIATLAKVTASSIDDVAANAVKASSKAVGVVIDDTAVDSSVRVGPEPRTRATHHRQDRARFPY